MHYINAIIHELRGNPSRTRRPIKGKKVKKILEFVLTIASKMKITGSIETTDATKVPDGAMKERFSRLSAPLTVFGQHIFDIVKPGGNFATDCEKLATDSGTSVVTMQIPLSEGMCFAVKMDITTDGYQPAPSDLHELVAESIDPALEEIGTIWFGPDTDSEIIAAWQIDAGAAIREQLGLETRQLVGS